MEDLKGLRVSTDGVNLYIVREDGGRQDVYFPNFVSTSDGRSINLTAHYLIQLLDEAGLIRSRVEAVKLDAAGLCALKSKFSATEIVQLRKEGLI
jgi:hypothetical protein